MPGALGQAMNILHVLFGFSGRINRAKFWLAVLIYFVFFFGLMTVVMMTTSSMTVMLTAAVLLYVPLVVSGFAVGLKRLHDRNKTGWWLAAFYGVPLVLNLIGYYVLDEEGMPAQALLLISFGVNVWALVELGCMRGTIGSNDYGSDPLAPQPASPRPLR